MKTPNLQDVNSFDELASKMAPLPFTVTFINQEVDEDGELISVKKFYTASKLRNSNKTNQAWINELGIWMDLSPEQKPGACYRMPFMFPN
jgi:hypothetical protein